MTVSFALEEGDGKLVTLRLRRPELTYLLDGVLQSMSFMGDKAASRAREAFKTPEGRGTQEPTQPVHEPSIHDLHKRYGTRPIRRPRPTPQRRGMSVYEYPGSGLYLKVRFDKAVNYQRIAILVVFTCDDPIYPGLLLVCRWRVPAERGKQRYREFLVHLYGSQIRCHGTQLNDKPLTREGWYTLALGADLGLPVTLHELRLTPVPPSYGRGYRDAIDKRIYNADVPVKDWQVML